MRAIPWAWTVAAVVASCTYTVDPDFCTEDEHCDSDEKCSLDNECEPCEGGECPLSIEDRCAGDADCTSEEACAPDRVCRSKCVVDADCASGKCNNAICAVGLGEPCTTSYPDYTDCTDTCIDTNNHLETIESYCTEDCYGSGCPSGYECIDSYCRKVQGGLVCDHPSAYSSCGACVWDNCSSYLATCCEQQTCTDVLNTIDACDSGSNCDDLAYPSGFGLYSQDLAECVELFCDDGECFGSGL